MHSFGDRLRQLRKERSVSQSDLARSIGVSERALQNYETGEREVKLSLLRACAEFFDVSIDFLAGKTEDPETTNTDPEQEFIKWVKNNISSTFFYDFDSDPEESKAQMMRDLRYLYDRDRRRKK